MLVAPPNPGIEQADINNETFRVLSALHGPGARLCKLPPINLDHGGRCLNEGIPELGQELPVRATDGSTISEGIHFSPIAVWPGR